MLRSVDPNHDDCITFDEFLGMMQQIENRIANKPAEIDPKRTGVDFNRNNS
jgi:hypothetical protein